MVLKSQFTQNQGALFGAEVWQHHGHGVVPPVDPAQVGLLHLEVAAGQVHACQHVAHRSAVRGLRCQLAAAAQLVDHGGRFALEAVQDVTRTHVRLDRRHSGSRCCLARAGRHHHGGYRRCGLRVGHCNATPGQVLHEVQVKRQLLKAQPLKQRQDVLPLIGIDKVVGVFNAASAALDALQLAEAQCLQEVGGLFK